MSHVLESLGRGLLGRLDGAFTSVLGLDSDETREELQAIVDANADDLDARIRLAARMLRADEPTAALAEFRAILAIDEQHTAARIGAACALDDMGRIEDAIAEFEILYQSGAPGPAVIFCMGFCHERSGRTLEATTYYREALDACPTLRNAHERLAAIYVKTNRIAAAIKHYRELCRLDPDRTDVQLTLSTLMLRRGDGEAAIRGFGRAIANEPDNWASRDDDVSELESAGLLREAIEKLHGRIEIEPNNADARMRLGDLYSRVGNEAAATKQYSTAVEIAPDYMEAHVKLGTQHLRAGRFEEAARRFAAALELNDRLLGAYVGLGVAQHATGRSDEALASFDQARNIEPNSTLLFSEVARMQLKAAAAKESEQCLRSIVDEVDPARSRSTSGDMDLISQQIERHRQAAAQRPNHADVHYRLGLLLRNRGQVEESIACYRRAVEINPAYMKALVKLGLALREINQDKEAIEVFTRATQIHPEYVDLHYQLGLLFVQRHQFELAVERFSAAANGNPSNVDFQANLALALQNLGLVDRAQATWQIVNDLAPVGSEHAKQAQVALAKK